MPAPVTPTTWCCGPSVRADVLQKATVSVFSAVALTAVTACGGRSADTKPPPTPPRAAVTVTIRNIAFHPSVVTIKAGQTVGWWFDDGRTVHNVSAADNQWGSADASAGYFIHAFATPGTFQYICTIHTNMAGAVVVTPS